mgnify:CR=1 FL=1
MGPIQIRGTDLADRRWAAVMARWERAHGTDWSERSATGLYSRRDAAKGLGGNFGADTGRMTNAVESWTWPGCEGQKATVEVYSDAEFVALYCNDKPVGKKRTKKFRAIFKLPYRPGTLKAVALDKSGNALGETTLQTAGQKTRLHLAPEKTTLRADGQSLCFIPTTLTDADFTDGQIGVLTLLVKCGLASSNGEARKLVQGGGVSLNGEKVADFKQQLAKDFFNEECMIKKGKKTFHKAILG